MNGGTHIAFSLLAGGVFASAAANQDVAFGVNALTAHCAVATVVGALAPDIDNRQAPIGRALPFLSKPISRRWPHRTGLHSFVGLVTTSSLVGGILWLMAYLGLWLGPSFAKATEGKPPEAVGLVAQFFACGFFSHLVLDTATKQGVRWFWPLLKNPLGYPSLEEDRIVSGDRRWELIISLASLALFGGLVPVIEQGADTTLANVIGQFRQLRNVYVNAVEQEVVLEFEGYREQDKAPVSGRGVILAVVENCFAVFWNGQVQFVGEGSGDVHLLSGKCKTLEVAPVVREVVYRNATISDVVADIRGPILASGEIRTDRAFKTDGVRNARTVKATGTGLELVFASRADIEGLRVTAKESGMSVAEIEQEIEHRKRAVDSLVVTRQKLSDLYQRDRLFAQIKAHRAKLAALSDKLKEKARTAAPVRFSGRLLLRVVPEF